ncbi:succinate dehydrogenase, cytochrome b556 subunit [Pseudoxanthomonas composti]|uniref:Succinate dehydrogenase cytochrome b556 subunit n=1 Tax=Pseudoxanthomonas composti TaxID=2137479 RepID=A0A4Q1JYW8_9GAMM|nr:succinate dehydrogenase, cytochrome b556 subunit [Pseudoxanthomonas composti]RXR08259.1 succinate dehydrogenase, cytochrome b556 subunit [Pseudoxanthomonas composti]
MRPRPISPHLQVYRWQIQMVVSILNRATGAVLAVGAVAIAGVLFALQGDALRWTAIQQHLSSWYGLVLMAGWTWCLVFHSLAGLRHLLQDAGWFCSIDAFKATAWTTVIGSLALTALLMLVPWGRAGA